MARTVAGISGRPVGQRTAVWRPGLGGSFRFVGIAERAVIACNVADTGGKDKPAMPDRNRGASAVVEAGRQLRRACAGRGGADFGAFVTWFDFP